VISFNIYNMQVGDCFVLSLGLKQEEPTRGWRKGRCGKKNIEKGEISHPRIGQVVSI